MSTPRIISISFDRFPSPKGAATHIEAFARALGERFGIELVTVGEPGARSEPHEILPGVIHHRLPAVGPNLIARVMGFRDELARWWGERRPRVAHFRSIYEGYPIARRKGELCERIVFEVNGLPSIELKYHYPEVADDRELLAKLESQEQICIEAADCLVTPSEVTAERLVERGADSRRVHVIPNGVDPDIFAYREPRARGSELTMLYSGTMTAWQGVHHALEALGLYHRDFPARLRLAGPARARERRDIERRAETLGVLEFVELVGPVSREELARLHHEADVVCAPLLANDRNLVQGCCPLKVLEAMASGTPVIASDLPVVTALARPEIDALIVRPGSAKAIKDAMLRLRGEEGLELARRLGRSARDRVEREFTWERARRALVDLYEGVLDS